MHADGSIHLNLSSTTVDEQLDTGDVGAVVGSEEHQVRTAVEKSATVAAG